MLYCRECFFHLKSRCCRWLFSDVIECSPCLSKTLLLQAMHYVSETHICEAVGVGGVMLLVLGTLAARRENTVDLLQQRYPESGCQPWHVSRRIVTAAVMFECPSSPLPGEPTHKNPSLCLQSFGLI